MASTSPTLARFRRRSQISACLTTLLSLFAPSSRALSRNRNCTRRAANALRQHTMEGGITEHWDRVDVSFGTRAVCRVITLLFVTEIQQDVVRKDEVPKPSRSSLASCSVILHGKPPPKTIDSEF